MTAEVQYELRTTSMYTPCGKCGKVVAPQMMVACFFRLAPNDEWKLTRWEHIGYCKWDEKPTFREILAHLLHVNEYALKSLVNGSYDDIYTLGDDNYLIWYSGKDGKIHIRHWKTGWTVGKELPNDTSEAANPNAYGRLFYKGDWLVGQFGRNER